MMTQGGNRKLISLRAKRGNLAAIQDGYVNLIKLWD
jgi:hypothetical protein